MRETFAICLQRRIAVDSRGHVTEMRRWERLSSCSFKLEHVDRFSRRRYNVLAGLLVECLAEWKQSSQQRAACQEFQEITATTHRFHVKESLVLEQRGMLASCTTSGKRTRIASLSFVF